MTKVEKACWFIAGLVFVFVLFSNADAHLKSPEEMSQHTDAVWCDLKTTAYYTGMYERLSGTSKAEFLKQIEEDTIPSILGDVAIKGWTYVNNEILQGNPITMLNIQVLARGYYNKCIQNKEVQVYIDKHKEMTQWYGIPRELNDTHI